MFTGSVGNKRRVNLGGSSKGSETREQILERSRVERDRRKRNKLENTSATVIQAAWRAKHDVSECKQARKMQWCAQYGAHGANIPQAAMELQSLCLAELLAFADPASMQDVQIMAGVSQVILSTHDSSGQIKFITEAKLGQVECARVQLRARRLLSFVLKAFVTHSTVFVTGQNSHAPAAWSKLLDLACKLTDPNTWQPAVGAQAASVAASLIGYLAIKCHLFSSLAQLLLGGCPPTAPNRQAAAQMSMPEALALNLTVRFLSLKGHPEVAAAQAMLPRLLCVPLLWSRCPRVPLSVSARIWHHAVEALADMNDVSSLVAWLPADQLGGKAGAAAALLANLAQVSGTALQGSSSTAAVRFSLVAILLLAVVPMNRLLKVADTIMADVEDEEEQEPEASTSCSSSDTLQWPKDTAIPFEQYVHLHSLAEPALLKALVQQALPATSPGNTASPEMSAAVHRLCQMLQALMGIPALCQKALIFTAHQADFVRRLWCSYLQAAWIGGKWTASNDSSLDPGWMLATVVLSRVYSSYLNTAPDAHMYQSERPLPLSHLYHTDKPDSGLLALLKYALWQVLWVESSSATMPLPAKALRAALKESAGKLLTQLYDRNCRRQFAPAEAFQTSNLPLERFQAEMQTAANNAGGLMQASNTRVWGLLRHAPFLIPFQERAGVFATVVGQDRMQQREMAMQSGHGWGRQFFVTIHRTSLLQDGFEHLNKLQEGLKSRVQIRFIDLHGIEEAGIDGGGLFKEFMECLVKEGFDPNAGLFKATSDNRLYPNPSAQALVPDALAYFEFLGRMLGKAMYEGILIELPLAGFFLKKMRNPHSDINDLVTLDPELYRNLMFLRDYNGDFSDLALTFTTADNDVGQSREVELIPGGASKAVTAENVMEYIHRVANYRLNFQIKAASEAFWQGFYDLVAQNWVTMFSEEEVQMLISGGGEGLDVADMQAHVNYAGGYHEEHPVIIDFWQAVASFSPEEQSSLLKFITACSRAPLLGFKFLEPGLSIQMAGSMLDNHAPDRLPTAATCMNLLKLPPYRSAQQIRDKLLYAAQNASGFGLS